METLQFTGNFEDLDELRKYKKQICAQYPDQSVVVYDYRYKYPIVHSIDNNKSRMAYCRLAWGNIPTTQMLGKNNVVMDYINAIRCNKTVHITDDLILNNADIPFNCCKYPTLWVKEAIELGTTISKVSSKISMITPDYSQHLLKGLGISAKNFRILCNTRYMDLSLFKRLISLGIPKKDIIAADEIANWITVDFDNDCIKYVCAQCSDTCGFCIYSYRDYLRMRKNLPSAIKSQWPKCPNLKKYTSAQWHNKLLHTYNNLQDEIAAKRNKAQQSKYFEEVYPKAKEFELVDEVYSVICPEQITSLLAEGRILHHCVGSYIGSVASGNEYILFLRKTSDLDTPFFTINVLPNKKVRQIHGTCNCNLPDEIKPFIKKWANKFGLDISHCNGVYCHL